MIESKSKCKHIEDASTHVRIHVQVTTACIHIYLTFKDFIVCDGDGKCPGESKHKVLDDAKVVKERRRVDDFFAQETVLIPGFVRLH